MDRDNFLSQLARAEKALRATAQTLEFLRQLSSALFAVSAGESRARGNASALADTLCGLPRLSLDAWRLLAASDPLLGWLLEAREVYRKAFETHRSKSTHGLDAMVAATYRQACSLGFSGLAGAMALAAQDVPARDPAPLTEETRVVS